LFAILIVTISSSVHANQWRQEKTGESYSIHSQLTDESKFLRVKAEITLNAPLSLVKTFFGNGDKCWSWQGRCKNSKVMTQLSESEKIVQVLINMPWPITDREFFIHSQLEEDPQNHSILLTFKPASDVTGSGKYVVGQSNNTYLLKQTTTHQTELTIIQHTEFGGSVSPKIINSRLNSEFEKDVKSLISQVTKQLKKS
jgi:hypothetical protein